MQTLVIAYRHLHIATQKLVNHYSPHICLNHLVIKDNATEKDIIKNMDELRKYYSAPQFTYLKNSKNRK